MTYDISRTPDTTDDEAGGVVLIPPTLNAEPVTISVANLLASVEAPATELRLPAWTPTTTYRLNDLVRVGYTLWLSIVDNNLGNNPSTHGEHWARIGITSQIETREYEGETQIRIGDSDWASLPNTEVALQLRVYQGGWQIRGNNGTWLSLAAATTQSLGLMSAADKTKLDGVEDRAQVNDPAQTITQGFVDAQDAAATRLTLQLTGAPVFTFPNATPTRPGLMSREDKTTFDTLDQRVSTNFGATQRNSNRLDAHDAHIRADGAKLDTIETGAEVNVQADWSQTADSEDSFIRNKPTLHRPVVAGTFTMPVIQTNPTWREYAGLIGNLEVGTLFAVLYVVNDNPRPQIVQWQVWPGLDHIATADAGMAVNAAGRRDAWKVYVSTVANTVRTLDVNHTEDGELLIADPTAEFPDLAGRQLRMVYLP